MKKKSKRDRDFDALLQATRLGISIDKILTDNDHAPLDNNSASAAKPRDTTKKSKPRRSRR